MGVSVASGRNCAVLWDWARAGKRAEIGKVLRVGEKLVAGRASRAAAEELPTYLRMRPSRKFEMA